MWALLAALAGSVASYFIFDHSPEEKKRREEVKRRAKQNKQNSRKK